MLGLVGEGGRSAGARRGGRGAGACREACYGQAR